MQIDDFRQTVGDVGGYHGGLLGALLHYLSLNSHVRLYLTPLPQVWQLALVLSCSHLVLIYNQAYQTRSGKLLKWLVLQAVLVLYKQVHTGQRYAQ